MMSHTNYHREYCSVNSLQNTQKDPEHSGKNINKKNLIRRRKSYKRVRTAYVLVSLVLLISLLTCCQKSSEPANPAEKMVKEFEVQAKKGLSPDQIAENLSSLDWLPFTAMSMPVEEGYLNGFTKEIRGFSSGAVFGPLIGAIPFVAYVFELPADLSPQIFLKMLQDSADLRWNVCTQADVMASGVSGQTVFFVMSPLSFDEAE